MWGKAERNPEVVGGEETLNISFGLWPVPSVRVVVFCTYLPLIVCFACLFFSQKRGSSILEKLLPKFIQVDKSDPEVGNVLCCPDVFAN